MVLTVMNIFQKANLLKLRYPSPNGEGTLTTEELFDLSSEQLVKLAATISTYIKEEWEEYGSSKRLSDYNDKLDVILTIIDYQKQLEDEKNLKPEHTRKQYNDGRRYEEERRRKERDDGRRYEEERRRKERDDTDYYAMAIALDNVL